MAGPGGADGGNDGGSDGPWERWQQTLASKANLARRKQADPSYAPRKLFGGRKNIKINVGKKTNVTQAELAQSLWNQKYQQNFLTGFNPRKASAAGKKVVSQINDLSSGKGKYKGKSAAWRRNEAIRVLTQAGINNAAGRLNADFAGADRPAPRPRGGSKKPKTRQPNTSPVGGGPTSSPAVNTQIDATQAALNAAIAAINAQATGYSTTMQSFADSFSGGTETTGPVWPGAPTWVKTFDDYRKWKRMQSAETGYLSTVNTGSTGLSSDDYDDNVSVTTLTG
tara:strand:+ start:1258 stop:2103 length:846 start_codon:yes stop_codon:yes gene_type:complete